jgi:hypothetical protein
MSYIACQTGGAEMTWNEMEALFEPTQREAKSFRFAKEVEPEPEAEAEEPEES